MKKLKIYLDTSVISHLQADDAPEKMAKTLEFWKYLINGEYDAYISELVIAEFNNCSEPKKSKLEGLLRQAPIIELEIDDEVTTLADRYMTEGLFPNKYRDDAIHIAIASVFGCNVVVSWNFKHMVKIRTILGVNGVNKIMGYSDVEIVTPEVIVGEEDEENE
jgi:predicted nucleic acid-binding protein